MIVYSTVDSLAGEIYLAADDKFLRIVAFNNNWPKLRDKIVPDAKIGTNAILEQTKTELSEYFAGNRKSFGVPIHYDATKFQAQAWEELQKISYGETINYVEQAKNIGNAKAARAIGSANSMNPLSIIIPCHRVIGKSGSLSGYAGGIEVKKFLLALEARML